VTVVDIRGDKVRLGITAPREISVHRQEVYDAIRRENRAAAQVKPEDLKGGIVLGPKPNSQTVATQGKVPNYLDTAINEAQLGLKEEGFPLGAVLVRGDKIIARAHNMQIQKADPIAHAEMMCFTLARYQRTYADTVLYTTLMPGFISSTAIVNFGIPKVVVADTANFAGDLDYLHRHGVEVVDENVERSVAMLKSYITDHSDDWKKYMRTAVPALIRT
jgi:cytosine/creatinine deaminase